ncbi:MAG: GtrA family protein [Acidimicrobiales bacterium]
MVRRILDEHGVRLLRYAGVSAVAVTVGQTLLFLFYRVLELDAVLANTMAVTLATIPSYLLNRAWVWQKNSAHSFTTEILPFWGMAVLGLILSNILVHWVEGRWDSWVLINGANLAAFGLLWVGKYMILDRVLFRPTGSADCRDTAEFPA